MIKQLFLNKYFLISLGALLLLTIIFSSLKRSQLNPPQIINATPPSNSSEIAIFVNPLLVFDIPVNTTDLTITSTPPLTWQLTQISPTSVELAHTQNFQPSTTYTIHLAWRNLPLNPYIFTTMAVQTDPDLINKLNEELARDYPLGQSTPYTTNSIRIIYSKPRTLEITILNPQISSEEAIALAEEWVTSHNLSVDTHQYTVISNQNQ